MTVLLTRGGELVFKGGYDARTRKRIKRNVFIPTVNVSAYIEKGFKNGRIWKKGVCFSTPGIEVCV